MPNYFGTHSIFHLLGLRLAYFKSILHLPKYGMPKYIGHDLVVLFYLYKPQPNYS